MKPTLILRADASLAIGVGHVMRCLALAQAWRAQVGGKAVFCCTKLPPKIARRLIREHMELRFIDAVPGSEQDAFATVADARAEDAEWVVVDGYSFTPAYFEALHTAGLRVLALDDMAGLERYPVDIVLNQNMGAAASNYTGRTGAETMLLLGPRYSLLRREFRRIQPRDRSFNSKNLRHILVTLGGSDDENFTAAILNNLKRTVEDHVDVIILAGAANPHVEKLCALAESAPFACDVCVDAKDVASLMNWADVAITAGGSTVWELAALRVPALIGASSDNQLAGLAGLAEVPFFKAMRIEELVACNLASEVDRLCSRAAALTAAEMPFDAEGALRVVQLLKSTPAILSAA
jgi:UDP-2,4-diacetamido-2,4,6-trideoxy-beta-L-altropyranose hydrolase